MSHIKKINTYFLTYTGGLSSCPSCSSNSSDSSTSSLLTNSENGQFIPPHRNSICTTCGGKLSFCDLPTNVTMVSQIVTTTTNNTTTTTEVRLCNCIPTVHTGVYSYNSNNLGKGVNGQQSLYVTASTSALPTTGNLVKEDVTESIEAKLDTMTRSESGF